LREEKDAARGGSGKCPLARRLFWVAAVVHVLVVAVCLLLAAAARGQEAPITVQERVGNRRDHGICWWCCAEMAGRHAGIAPLTTITRQVVESGIGFHSGATDEAVAYWLRTLRVRARTNPHGNTRAGYDWLMQQLREGLPVVASISTVREGNHAILLTHITSNKVDFDNGQGYRTRDWVVRYIDPNYPDSDYTHTWQWFVSAWTGRAYAFSPREQDPSLLLRRDTAGAAVWRSFLPPPSHAVAVRPFTGKLPSNQDIDDGIHRPADTLEYGCFVYPAHDYFQQYRRLPAGGGR
jgi:hypothetical protein